MEGLSDVTAIAAGEAHSLILTKAGEVYSFGDNWVGQF
ncbi:RCC1 domain-containing protein [Cohnella sp. WQ 127256]